MLVASGGSGSSLSVHPIAQFVLYRLLGELTMKAALLALVACCASAATLTTVTGTLTRADSVRIAYCGVYVAPNTVWTNGDGSTAAPGKPVTARTNASGVFSVAVYPNDATTPSGTSYKVTYDCGIPEETWVVPTNGSPVTRASVATASTPTPTYPYVMRIFGQSGDITAVYGNIVGLWSNCSSPTTQYLRADGSCQIPPGAGGSTGTVTSVAVSSADLSVSGSPITSNGTFTLNLPSSVDLSGKTQFTIPVGSGYTATSNGHLGFDTGTSRYKGYASGAAKSFAFTSDIPANTDSLTEGLTNQYFTTTRARGSISSSPAGNYNSTSGVMTLRYQTVGIGGTSQTARTRLNMIGAGGVSIANSDNSGSDSSDVTVTGPAHILGMSFGTKSGPSLTTGQTNYLPHLPWACTISRWDIAVDAGTITIDVLKTSSTTTVPTSSITASATPSLASNTLAGSSTLTGWTTSVSAGDSLGFAITAVSGVTTATLTLTCQ